MIRQYFVSQGSIVREIWSRQDVILFIFAGSAAEFALNKAVDWLYFTGKIPKDPLGRLLSTVDYARGIIFATYDDAVNVINRINSIHGGVEAARQAKIPDWAYRDVLYMLLDYSVKAYEMVQRKLTHAEKEEIFSVFTEMGTLMGLQSLPANYKEWVKEREMHIHTDLVLSNYTQDLYQQYRKHLGFVRYELLLGVQAALVPNHAATLLQLKHKTVYKGLIAAYKYATYIKVDRLLDPIVLPGKYKLNLMAANARPA